MANPTVIGIDPVERPRSRQPAYWIFLPLVLASLWYLQLTIPLVKAASWWTVGVPILALVAGLVGPICRALGLGRAALICAVLILGFYWTLSFYLMIGFTMAGKGPLGLIYFWYFFFPPLIVAIATTISFAWTAGLDWALGCVGVGLACGIVAIALGPASKVRETSWVRPLDPTDLRSEIRALSKCTQDFAISHPDISFPESLEQLSQQGTACYPEALLSAQQKGFTISYQPGSRDGDGRITTYSLKARETTPKSKDTSSIFTDESGLIWTRYDGPHGMGSTQPLLQGENGIAKVRECLDNAASGNPWRFVAGQSEITTSEPRQIIRHCIGEEHFVGEHKLLYYGYSYDYAFTNASDGKPDGFTVAIRPEPYGVAGIRSFLAIETSDVPRKHYNLSVHATPQDRPASVNDPLALGSEVGLGFWLAKTEN
jgi:hypothetical protein